MAYDLTSLPDEEVLRSDLQEMVRLYSKLIARGGREIFEDAPADDGDDLDTGSIEERRRYRQHLRIERAPGAGKKAKKIHGYACQVCGLDFEKIYGPCGKKFIEAHHLTPLSELPRDVPVTLGNLMQSSGTNLRRRVSDSPKLGKSCSRHQKL